MSEHVSVLRWLVVDNGCNECSVKSAVVGAYDTREEAQAVSATRWRTTDGGSTHTFPVFDLARGGAQLPWAEDEAREATPTTTPHGR